MKGGESRKVEGSPAPVEGVGSSTSAFNPGESFAASLKRRWTQNKIYVNDLLKSGVGVVETVKEKEPSAKENRVSMMNLLSQMEEAQNEEEEDNDNPNAYVEKSLSCLTLDNCLRRICISLIENIWFDRFILFIIFINSICLATSDLTVVDKNTSLPTGNGYSINNLNQPAYSLPNAITENTDLFFTVVFVMEAIIKIVAMGFMRAKGSYVHDPWNLLDLLVVVTSVLDIIPNMPQITMIRTLRVLRPLKSLHSLPKLRALVISLLNAIPGLGNVLLVLFFMCLIFGIFGVQLWSGNMKYRCRLTAEPIYLPPNLVDTYR
jgi:hypothetical protein